MTSVPRKTNKKSAQKSKKTYRQKKGNFLTRLLMTVVCIVVWFGLMFVAVKMGEEKVGGRGVSRDDPVRETSMMAVPVMEIFLNGTTLDEVHENGKDVKYDGNVVVLDGVEYDEVELKGRGNSSWAADKKSYRIKFDKKTSLLGMEKSKKWALIANNIDDSLMRNDLAQHLMGMLVDDYPFFGEFVELKVDGEYLGLYYLIRTMGISKEAVNLSDPMGVMMELDNAWCEEEEEQYWTSQGNCLAAKDVVADDNADVAATDFVRDFDALEEAAKVGDYGEIEKLIDVESFAKYFILAEITSDPDAYITSWFMYKDGTDDKIHAGLAWDYDLAFGNRRWVEFAWPEGFYSPTTRMARMKYMFDRVDENKFCNYGNNLIASDVVKVSRLVCEMMNAPEFREEVSKVYREKIMGRESEILRYIDMRAELLSEAAERDAKLWKKGDFETEVEYLKWWMDERMKFFEQTYVKHLVPMESETI